MRFIAYLVGITAGAILHDHRGIKRQISTVCYISILFCMIFIIYLLSNKLHMPIHRILYFIVLVACIGLNIASNSDCHISIVGA